MSGSRHRFRLSDTAQQVVGGFLLAGPFVVTEEVWTLAAGMTWIQTLVTFGLVLGIGHGTLYTAEDRDPEVEADVGGVPLRFVSLVCVSYGSVLILALTFGAPATFLSGIEGGSVWPGLIEVDRRTIEVTLTATSVGSVFSVVGAATADSVF